MVQTSLMATINQETENPSNALERQVQTLATMVEQLTQRNQELEQQLNQRNERCQEGQCDERDTDEQNGSHLPTRDRQEREDQEENNIPNRRDGLEDTSCPSEMEVSAMRMQAINTSLYSYEQLAKDANLFSGFFSKLLYSHMKRDCQLIFQIVSREWRIFHHLFILSFMPIWLTWFK